ncbi:glycosyltransferase family 2 protein [Allorhodopirellula solitaria]|uniref:Undecaprenyl-phosphate 4-deoxy-4-formamido-L-arabinose transferase n=1 Tax=Allorhodopirellula solitaria TaxID=2527987 RepID=A0A5C5XXM6_9BACT|nr:glycosyltransferase family 2 protein [Allorhodopirellula solitaria]TWT67438.1 Undecaprenyl-phosphate 4-deoxy-4-formamido-L-arabinose transferase [Allorhodopirellula solitaria]
MNTPTDQSWAAQAPVAQDPVVLASHPVEPQSQPATVRNPAPTPDLSIVIPAMNEEESLGTLHERILDVCQRADQRVEVIFIDDGSSDATWARMSDLATAHRGTRAIRLRRNFGKAAALSAGFSVARGKIVITMDADLQDDPDEIPRFLETLDKESLDVVSGWKRVRHDPWHKVLPSRVFNAMVSGLTGVRLHDHNCGFKAYRHDVLDEVDLYGERHRFIPVLAAARGWKVGEIEVLHHPRVHGQSKYGLSRLGKGFLDLMSIYLLTGYARRPLHLIGSAGLMCFAVGSLGMIYLSVMWVLTRLGSGEPLHLHATAVFYYCILAVLLGAQCVLAGLIAELIVSVSAARDRSLRTLQGNATGAQRGVADESLPRSSVLYSVSETVGRR